MFVAILGGRPGPLGTAMTPHARPLRRAVAFLVNWGVQAAAAVIVLALASLVIYVEVPGGITLPLLILVPGALIDALLIARTGATPGQHALGIRVERREGGPPSLARALARQGIFGVWLVLVGILAPVLPLVALGGLADLVELDALGALVIGLSPLIAIAGLVAALLVTRMVMERDAHLRAPFDRLGGTVVARREPTRRSRWLGGAVLASAALGAAALGVTIVLADLPVCCEPPPCCAPPPCPDRYAGQRIELAGRIVAKGVLIADFPPPAPPSRQVSTEVEDVAGHRCVVVSMRDLGEVGRSIYVRGLIATRDPARHPEEALVFADEQR